MNCEKGDLAIFVNPVKPSERIYLGRIVTCESPGPVIRGYETWKCPELSYIPVGDIALRPIRNNPGTDETLIYAGFPKKAPVPSKLKEKA